MKKLISAMVKALAERVKEESADYQESAEYFDFLGEII